jgi:energy-coupling factor transporter ATP-binding protein EcfA2/predicted ABC-type ATPase
MISEIRLINFRGFDDHIVPLRPFTIIVGRNNAGKSTIVEALRLISIVVGRYKGILADIPTHWTFPRTRKGVQPYKDLEINTQSIFHRYSDPPASIIATFSSGEIIRITIDVANIIAHRSRVKGVPFDRSNTPSRVSILPQVAPVSREERVLNGDYVRSAISSPLAPLHFRNQLHLLPEYFPAFKDAAERTWAGLRIDRLDINGEPPNPAYLSLFVRDGEFTGEISWMGHGLQMWLQMIWFLSRSENHETVILDEPDVYMHADLQRRLVQFVRKRHQQVIIATHSSEIMAEVLPENILVIDRSRAESNFASSLPAVQRILSGIGSVHNLQLSRLWTARRFLIVEGKDVQLLKQFQNKLFPDTIIPIDTIPSSSVGGWGGWNQAVGSEILLKNAGGDGIVTYSIFDSDYYPPEAISNRYTEAKRRGISLHIWSRKELENYTLIPEAICRAVHRNGTGKAARLTIVDIENKLEEVSNDLKETVVDSIATQIQSEDRKLTAATANQKAREAISKKWKTKEGRLSVIPGKEAVTRLSRWTQETFRVSLSATLIVNNMLPEEIPDEMRNVLTSIEECDPFPERQFTK